jgi:hypothetical protein
MGKDPLYTYSEKDPESAEYFFRYNFEDGYPIIAKKITTGKMLTSEERKDLLIFALVTRFRSPSYVIRTGEERIDAFEHIMGSACNEIEAIRPECKQRTKIRPLSGAKSGQLIGDRA